MKPLTLAASALVLASLEAAPAFADPTPEGALALNWVRLPGAESCIGPAELAEKVELRLGRRVFAPSNGA